MKKIVTTLLLTSLILWNCFSQTFPFDESGKIVYQEIVEVDSLKKEIAYQNGAKWFTTLKHEQVTIEKKDSIEGTLSGQATFPVYDQGGVFKKLSGKISYSITLDVKDGKYRYSISDFIFHYYKQDRTYTMVETGKTKKLEEIEAQGWQKLWAKHRTATNDEINRNISSLKIMMRQKPGIAVTKVSKKVEW